MAAAAILNLPFCLFCQMVCFRWQPATSLQNFIHLRQLAAELLLFVQKSKTAATAILDLILILIIGQEIDASVVSRHSVQARK